MRKDEQRQPAPPETVTVRVPATTANLGPGFDALGLALTLYNEVELAWKDTPGVEVIVAGEGEASLPRDGSNIAVQAVNRALAATGAPSRGYRLTLTNAIPLSRGLGSSAAARVGAVMAANELSGRLLSSEDLLALAVDLEGHPDNVAAALLGGLVASTIDDQSGRAVAVKVRTGPLPDAVVLIPQCQVSTEAAREVLPGAFPKADAAFNLGHACLTLAALIEGRDDLLRVAMHDRLHEPYRERLMPWLTEVKEAALNAGAAGAALSGAGSTVLAFARTAHEAVAEAMLEAVRPHEVAAQTLTLAVDEDGAALVA